MVPSATSENGSLPQATRARWQPIRSGLVNLYRYDYEEFHFEQGHLLLRGNNGTGKSRVLALQLPFLLDGETAAHRIEPDGDLAKKIEWNLLLGKHADRLGYTWIEFGRRDDDGSTHYLTLGCGLRAVEGRGLVGKWFFVSHQRIGQDLFLLGAAGQVLTREKLNEAIGASGEVFTTAKEYRAAVDRRLFQLGTQRYEALVNLLVQLRQPQLSRQLDEKRLSRALSEALPPVAQTILDDVAEAFRGLDADRTALEAFREAQHGAEAFLVEYRRYAQIAARRRAADVRMTHSAYEHAMRRLRQAQAELEAADERQREVVARLEKLTVAEQAAQTAVATLSDSPQMRDAKTLDAARRAAGERRADADRAAAERSKAAQARLRCDQDRDAEAATANAAREQVRELEGIAQSAAAAAGLEAPHAQAIQRLELPKVSPAAGCAVFPAAGCAVADGGRVDAAEAELAEATEQRRRGCRHVEQLNRSIEQAASALAQGKAAQSQLTGQLDEALESQRLAHAALARAADELLAAYRAWADALVELAPLAADDLAAPLSEWCEAAEGRSPVTSAVNEAAAVAERRLAGFRAEVEQRLEAAKSVWQELRDEQRRLAEGHHEPPPVPHTRDAAMRADRPGAPFWALCDFAPEVAESKRAGIEAALEAAGLLDAWVTPDGKLLAAGQHDTVVAVGTSPAAPEGRELSRVLAPATDRLDPRAAAVSEDTVRSVLRHVGYGAEAGSVWVAADGRWQFGPLHGAWSKPAAQHLGAAAREAARLRRLDELRRELAGANAAIDAVKIELTQIAARERAARRESAAAPSDGVVRSAVAKIAAAAGVVVGLRLRVAEADKQVVQRRSVLSAATDLRDRDAADLGLAAWVERLAEALDALAAYRQALAGLWPTLRGQLAAERQAALAAQRAADALADEHRRDAHWLEAETKAQTAAVERDTLEAAVGAAVEEILRRLQEARRCAEQVRNDKNEAAEQRTAAAVSVAVANKAIGSENELLQRDTLARDAAIDSLRRYVATKLLRVAAVATAAVDHADVTQWSATRAVDAARAIEAALVELASDDDAWQRSQKAMHRHFQDLAAALSPHGYEASATTEDNLFVVTVPFQGRTCSMAELRDALADEVATRQGLLDAREREVLENHLIGEVALHLHDRLHEAERLVAEMNQELHDRPTSTGMTLRFTWQPADDGPPGLPEARRRLLAAGGTWSPAEREALGRFLHEQIRLVQAAEQTGSWLDHLTKAFDYRSWHRFGVERKQDGQWKRLTRRTHGTGSGGEKAIALTLPQFAAAAAHYRTAHQYAPRLILFDKAFVGIDSDMRSKCMGLLGAFDLDFVMTSEREWGCYSTLAGVAIYQLATRPDVDAVGITRWVWNGRERVRDDRRFARSASTVDGDGNGLFT